VTLEITPALLPASATAIPEFIRNVARLRRHALGAPFDRALKSVVTKGAAVAPEAVIRMSAREPVFILPRPDRVAVIFALHFADATDRAIARIVCLEFVEAQRHVSTAPPVNYSDREPPLELRGRPDLLKPSEDSFVGYITFSMMPRQFDSDAKRANAVNLLTQFHTYLDYHIKAAKSYLHTRMRTRVDGWMQVRSETRLRNTPAALHQGPTFPSSVLSFFRHFLCYLQVLNRSFAEDPFAAREKKLASGKTFVKK